MKNVVLLILIASCTQKYADFDLIRKVDFQKKSYERPIPVTQVMPDGKDELDACFNQWLFFTNAEKKKDAAIPMVVKSLCPGRDYLLDAQMVETWWTTLFYTRSCVEITTKCANARQR